MRSEKLEEIARLVEKVGKADQEFGSELLQIAERLLLQQLTRSRGGSGLNSVPEMVSKLRDKSSSSHLLGVDGPDRGANLARGFSAAVEMLEGMDSDGLSDMVSLLRGIRGPDLIREERKIIPPATPIQETKLIPPATPIQETKLIAPATPIQETNVPAHAPSIRETLPHVVSCLEAARLQAMQKVIYDKFGSEAPQRLYRSGEVYGNRVALELKKDLGIVKAIRYVEQVAKLAGWGSVAFHRVDPLNIECTIENTIFSYKKGEIKNSCYFASGITGGIMSTILQQGGHFVARETECVSDGRGRCKFEITSTDHGKNSNN